MPYCEAISSRSPISDAGRTSATFWLLDGSRVHEDDLAFFTARLGASETHRWANFAREERQRQFLLGRMLLRIAAADLTGMSPNEIRVTERLGKSPQLIFPNRQRSFVNFSLSHSREWVACAISPQATLGLDIEVMDPKRDIFGISKMVFHPIEHSWLMSQPDTERLSAFYSLWSAREALFKLHNNLGHEIDVLKLGGGANSRIFQCRGWHRYQLPMGNLSIEVFSERQLSGLRQRVLGGLTRADLDKGAG
mgnify:CR=1 FL=1